VSVSQKGKSIAASIKETQLYAPVKAYFTALGYEVKGEVGAADLVAVPKGAPEGAEPIIVELKTSFSLTLFGGYSAQQNALPPSWDWAYHG